MSARIETRSNDHVGRIVFIAALAGLTGVAITVLAAASLLLGADAGSAPVVVKSAPLEPGYVDYGLRHPAIAGSEPVAPADDDYGLRHPLVVQSAPLEPGYLDYGLRHPVAAEAGPIATESDDYGLRHPAP